MLKVTQFFTLALISSGLVACATIPDDAPQEFVRAEESMNTMDQKNVEDLMPQTSERAHRLWDDALTALDNSKDENAEVTEADAAAIAHVEQLVLDRRASRIDHQDNHRALWPSFA